jgi:hypothetical protein
VLHTGVNYEVIAENPDDFFAYLNYVQSIRPGQQSDIQTLYLPLDAPLIGNLIACCTSFQNRFTGQIGGGNVGIFLNFSPRHVEVPDMEAIRVRINDNLRNFRLTSNP